MSFTLVDWSTASGVLSRGTGGRWSDRAKAAYKSWQDYIIAVKGRQSESAAFRRISLISSSGDSWWGLVHDGVMSLHIVPSSGPRHAEVSQSDQFG
jgi:hypothetical protein